MTSRFFTVRSTDIAHDAIDGESVIIDMARGIYYRLDGPTAVAWQALLEGAGTMRIAAMLTARFAAEEPAVAAEVDRFVDELHANGLIEPRDEADEAVPAIGAVAERAPFAGLVVHRFTDLQELFWIDPVHQVDDAGWPHRALTTG
jgi:hypothetical protein